MFIFLSLFLIMNTNKLICNIIKIISLILKYSLIANGTKQRELYIINVFFNHIYVAVYGEGD